MNDTSTHNTPRGTVLQNLLAQKTGGRIARFWPWLIAVFCVLLIIIFFVVRSGKDSATPRYVTEAASVGSLVVTVSATGNLQPTNQVDVGSELSGIINQVYVDVNDRVQKGQVLARLDLSKLQDAVTKSRASLVAAEAQVLQAQATVAEARASLARYRHVAELSGGKVPSQSEMDTAEATLKRAQANEAGARANVAQARANLQSDETNLAKASIRSPINGVVLSRAVEPGQTVAASFQAPVLFTLAEDLAKMELQVDVDEADVGQVQTGQKATFTVDAWPDRQYQATIRRVGYGSQEVNGVISYLTVLDVANDDLSLRPGMTGMAEITTQTRKNVLLVPNAALRFTPATTISGQKRSGASVMGALMPRPPRMVRNAPNSVEKGAARVWVLRNGEPVPIRVRTGASNGKMTEIVGGDLKPGMEVITETKGNPS